jgi:uncharacterized protein YbcC (UPF0753/DUF2309 family)
MKNYSKTFVEEEVLHKLKHYLPSQTPLKDFIHHNSLHAFQSLKFYDAIFSASQIFGYQATLPLSDFRKLYKIGRINDLVLERTIQNSKGKSAIESWKYNLLAKKYDEHVHQRVGNLRVEWKNKYHINLDNLVQPLLFRILSNYLDQGIAIWNFPMNELNFIDAIKAIESNSSVSLFKTNKAKELLFDKQLSITKLLHIIVGNEAYFEQYLLDQQFSHRGWSGMIATVEAKPETLLSAKKVSLNDVIIFELLLELDALEDALGSNWNALANATTIQPTDIFEKVEKNELHEVLQIWQDAFEWSYYDEMLAGIQQLNKQKSNHVDDLSASS